MHKPPNILYNIWQNLSQSERLRWWDQYFDDNPEISKPQGYTPPDQRQQRKPNTTTSGNADAGNTTGAQPSGIDREPPAPAVPARYETMTKCATMGSQGLHTKEQSRVEEIQQIHDDLSTDCPERFR